MKHLILPIFLAFFLLSANAQYTDYNSPAEMQLSGPVRSMAQTTAPAVRDSSGNIVKDPAAETPNREKEHYEWSSEGKTLVAAYPLLHCPTKDVYHYRNGLLRAIDSYEHPVGLHMKDTAQKKRLLETYPDSLVLSDRRTFHYDRKGRLSKTILEFDDWKLETPYRYGKERLPREKPNADGVVVLTYNESGQLVIKEKVHMNMIERTLNTYENGLLVKETEEFLISDTLQTRRISVYDQNGFLMSRTLFKRSRETGAFEKEWSILHVNDEHGNPVSTTTLSKEKETTATMSYVYDDRGNWIRRTKIDENGQLVLTERTFSYY